MFDWVFRAFFSVSVFLGLAAVLLVFLPNSPLPDRLNPRAAFAPTEPPNFLTDYKMGRDLSKPSACLGFLGDLDADFAPMSTKTDTPQCGIENRVTLRRIAGVAMPPLETQCRTALRLGLWLYHNAQPAARAVLGTDIRSISHFGSYSCRRIRRSDGQDGAMSEHATANAVDISGFRTAKGTQITLLNDWTAPQAGAFLKQARNGACQWFNATLSPDYNSLHADHFHFDHGRWRTCR